MIIHIKSLTDMKVRRQCRQSGPGSPASGPTCTSSRNNRCIHCTTGHPCSGLVAYVSADKAAGDCDRCGAVNLYCITHQKPTCVVRFHSCAHGDVPCVRSSERQLAGGGTVNVQTTLALNAPGSLMPIQEIQLRKLGTGAGMRWAESALFNI
jgi:hypothetical protein